MIRLINQNNPFFVLLFSLIIIVATRFYYIDASIDLEIWQLNAAPLTAFLFKVFEKIVIQITWVNLTLSGLLILVNALYINSIIVKHKIIPKNNFLVAWLYILFMHLFPEWIILSPVLLASIFYTYLFSNIYQLKDDKKIISRIVNLGLAYGLSILIWYPSIILLPFLLAGFFTYSANRFRYLLTFFMAGCIPIYYIFFVLFMKGESAIHQFKLLFSTFQFNRFGIEIDLKYLIIIIIIILLAIIGSISVNIYKNTVIKEIRQFINFIFLLTFLLILGLVFQNLNFKVVLIPFVFPLSIYIAVFINTIKRKFIMEVGHLALILLIILSYFNF